MKKPFECTQTGYFTATGTSETTPWLQHTRWAELFRDRSLGIIVATAKQPASQWSRNYLLGQWQGFSMSSSAETEAQLQIILLWARLDVRRGKRSNEIKMMQHVLYLAGQLQLGEDGHVSNSSDIEDDERRGQNWHYDSEIPSDSTLGY
ncbi:hypothetical protein FOXYSP1_19483 [Fusarium oxysporum f. sp. phaseoli]